MILLEFLTAQPAPLIVASCACYMIATALLSFGSCFALWTIDKIGAALSILKEFFFMFSNRCFLLTSATRVPLHAALEAHLEATSTD